MRDAKLLCECASFELVCARQNKVLTITVTQSDANERRVSHDCVQCPLRFMAMSSSF